MTQQSKLLVFYKTLVFIGFVVLLILGEMHHEIWRDEARALSIARSAQSILDLPFLLKNEGHPILWYICLHYGFLISQSTYILPILSLSFAIGFAFLLIYKSPFPVLFSILILFGFWGIYEYGINCRNYGIAVFFMFLFAHFKTQNPKLDTKAILMLCLAMQCNFYSAVFSMLLGTESIWQNRKSGIKVLWHSLLLLISFAFTAWVVTPDQNSLVVTAYKPLSLLSSFWDIGYGFEDFFFHWFDYKHGFVTCILLLSSLCFIRTPTALFFILTSMVFMNIFELLVRHNYLHHQGMWFIYLLVQLWLNYKSISIKKTSFSELKNSLYNFKKIHLTTLLQIIGISAVLFISSNNLHRGIDMYIKDWVMTKTDAPMLADYLHKNSNENEVWISEPDFIFESIMYYNYHPYFLPRENRFSTYVHFTKQNDSIVSLSQILDCAESFKEKSLLFFERSITQNDSVYNYAMKQFDIDTAGKRRLFNEYELLDSFNGNYFTDEHYFVYKKRVTKVD